MKLKFNPEELPVHSVAGEDAVPESHLSSAWLKQRFAQPGIWTPETTDEHLLSTIRSFKPASVLMPLVLRDTGLTMLLTHRAAHLNDHAGQISFPGGRFEDSDRSAIETALRETEEEIGLHRRHVDVLGVLPDYKTGTGYQVTPVVSLVQPPFDLKTDPFEVALIIRSALVFFNGWMPSSAPHN